MEGWQVLVVIMDELEENHSQTAYAVLHNSLQKERDFVQRVTPDIGTEFHPVENMLCNAFLLDLFKGNPYQIPGRAVTGLPVNNSGISLPDPTQNDRSNWTASCVIPGHLVLALCRTDDFWSGDRALLMEEVRDEICRCHTEST